MVSATYLGSANTVTGIWDHCSMPELLYLRQLPSLFLEIIHPDFGCFFGLKGYSFPTIWERKDSSRSSRQLLPPLMTSELFKKSRPKCLGVEAVGLRVHRLILLFNLLKFCFGVYILLGEFKMGCLVVLKLFWITSSKENVFCQTLRSRLDGECHSSRIF